MFQMEESAKKFKTLLSNYKKISIISHINPDPDTIGTALGIYVWLKEHHYQVEIVNVTKTLPVFLDFLPNFAKIKKQMDFEDSLIISCDCGSMDRLGVDTKGRELVNIDHHTTNNNFGTLNIVDSHAVSSSELAYALLKIISPISKDSATAFYVALISDTINFTTSSVIAETFTFASELISLGVDVRDIISNMQNRRSLASLRILSIAIDSMKLKNNAKIAIMKITKSDMLKSGATFSDLDGVVDYARSLATVEIAMILLERENDIKVSVRSKRIDIVSMVMFFGGGGHMVAGGFETDLKDMTHLEKELIGYIEMKGLLQ